MGRMVFLTAMFTRIQHKHISLLAVIALLIGLVAAVPHYGHADTSHGVPEHAQNHNDSNPENTASDIVDDSAATECDHGCHLGHHFNGVLGDGPKNFAHIASYPPDFNPQKFSLIIKRRNLRPPISQIS